MTEQELSVILKKGNVRISGGRVLSKSKNQKPVGRVRSSKIEYDGHVFDSKLEAKIYGEYKFDPDIVILELQPQFTLLNAFKRNGKTHRNITYMPDFKITIKGVEWIIEVKSAGTLKANSKSYPIRRKLFLSKYPDLNFREIIFDGKKRTEIEY